MKILITALLLTTPFYTFAGVDISGGGHGVEYNGEICLLDLFEGGLCQNENQNYTSHVSQKYSAALAIGIDWEENISTHEKNLLAGILANIWQKDPALSFALFKTINTYSWFFVDAPLSHLAVSSEVAIENVYRVASRSGYGIYIYKNLWTKMNSTNKVALIIHEALAALAPTDLPAPRVRQIVGTIFSANFGSLHRNKFYSLLRNDFPNFSTISPLDPALHLYQNDNNPTELELRFDPEVHVDGYTGSRWPPHEDLKNYCAQNKNSMDLVVRLRKRYSTVHIEFTEPGAPRVGWTVPRKETLEFVDCDQQEIERQHRWALEFYSEAYQEYKNN